MEWWVGKEIDILCSSCVCQNQQTAEECVEAKIYTGLCVLCTHTHFFISSIQNKLVMGCATRNWHILLYFLQNKILNTCHLEVYLICWNLKTYSEKLKAISFYGWWLREKIWCFLDILKINYIIKYVNSPFCYKQHLKWVFLMLALFTTC